MPATATRPELALAEILADLCFSGSLRRVDFDSDAANDRFRAVVECVSDITAEIVNAPTRLDAITIVTRIRKNLHQADADNRNG